MATFEAIEARRQTRRMADRLVDAIEDFVKELIRDEALKAEGYEGPRGDYVKHARQRVLDAFINEDDQ